jgi:hypothetical protein
MPDARVVVHSLPAGNGGEKGIHHDELFGFRGKLLCVGIGDHQPDVVPDNSGFLHAQRSGKSVGADGGRLHVQAVSGNFGIADTGEIGAITVNFSAKRGMIGRHIRKVCV